MRPANGQPTEDHRLDLGRVLPRRLGASRRAFLGAGGPPLVPLPAPDRWRQSRRLASLRPELEARLPRVVDPRCAVPDPDGAPRLTIQRRPIDPGARLPGVLLIRRHPPPIAGRKCTSLSGCNLARSPRVVM